MSADKVQLHALWRETTRYVDTLAQAVREAKRVDEASNFGRWLRFSGVLKILEAHQAPGPLEVDAKTLAKKTDDLVYECGQLYRNGKHDPRYAASDIAEINRKLDIIAAHVSTVLPNSSPVMEAATDDGNAESALSFGLFGASATAESEANGRAQGAERPAPPLPCFDLDNSSLERRYRV